MSILLDLEGAHSPEEVITSSFYNQLLTDPSVAWKEKVASLTSIFKEASEGGSNKQSLSAHCFFTTRNDFAISFSITTGVQELTQLEREILYIAFYYYYSFKDMSAEHRKLLGRIALHTVWQDGKAEIEKFATESQNDIDSVVDLKGSDALPHLRITMDHLYPDTVDLTSAATVLYRRLVKWHTVIPRNLYPMSAQLRDITGETKAD